MTEPINSKLINSTITKTAVPNQSPQPKSDTGSIFSDAKNAGYKPDNSSTGPIGSGDNPVSQFIELDKNCDLKVSANEYIENIMTDYLNNGGQLPGEYADVGEFINAKYAEFKKFAGDDVSMNIDEFKYMLFARASQQRLEKMYDVEPLEALNIAQGKQKSESSETSEVAQNNQKEVISAMKDGINPFK